MSKVADHSGRRVAVATANYVDRAIGERVSSRRSALGTTSAELARKLDVPVDFLSKLESGEERFSAKQLLALSSFLNVKPAYFFEALSVAKEEGGVEPEKPDWLAAVLGKENAPHAPGLRTKRIKEMLRRAVLFPGSLQPLEVQELAASVLVHLVGERKP